MPDIIDVKSIQIDSNRFDITTDEAIHRTRCANKSAFRNAIQKLTESHQIPITRLRQGEARATRYCEFAVKAVKALKGGDLVQLRELQQQISSLLASYEQLGEALGSRAGAAIEKGFAQGVSRSLKKISEA